jgi:phosphate transport system substrate-binding protein
METLFDRVRKSGTSRAYRQLIEGGADLIFVARSPAAAEERLAQERGIEMHAVPIAYDALVFLVASANPVEDLALESIRRIYTGEITRWTELEGEDEPIEAFVRNDLSGSFELMRELVLGERHGAELEERMLYSMMAPLLEVAVRPNAMAYGVFFFDEHIAPTGSRKRIAVDGVLPSRATIRDGTYPLRSKVYAVIRSDLDDGHPAQRIVAWLATREGRATVERTGYVAFSPSE